MAPDKQHDEHKTDPRPQADAEDTAVRQVVASAAPPAAATSQEEQPQQGGQEVSAELVLHPFNSSAQALWLCQQLKEKVQAQILYVSAFPEGTVIKVTLRKAIPLVEFLTGMKEVAEAWEEPTDSIHTGPEEASYRMTSKSARSSSNVVCVALRPL
ncbi:MAG: hypothetical protein HY535_04450 [Chloroflexi bacterium]|nr:hypothetical protein [Chloroflexota bacterium]